AKRENLPRSLLVDRPRFRFGQEKGKDYVGGYQRESNASRSDRQFFCRAGLGHIRQQCEVLSDPEKQGTHHSAANVCREALTGAAQVKGVNARKIVAPKTELRHGEKTGQEDADA